MMDNNVQWWGVVDFNGWSDRPDSDDQSVASRTERALHACEQADGFEAWGEPGSLAVKWWAPGDLNQALARLHVVVGIHPADFRTSERPERVLP
jgi:hypothetical protein